MNAPEKVPFRRQDVCVQLARHDAIVVINAEGLPIESGLFRVVWANRKSDAAFLLRFPDAQEPDGQENDVVVEGKKRRPNLKIPTRVSLTTLEDMAGKRWVVETRAPLPKRLNREIEDLSDFERKVMVRRKALVSSFMSDEDLIRVLEGRELGRYVSRAVEQHNANLADDDERLTRHHVYQVVYRLWLYECRDKALIPDSSYCGAPGKYRNPGKKKRGRPRDRIITGHAPDAPGINVGPDERTLIWLAWDQHGQKLGEYAGAYERMLDDHYTDGWKETESGLWVPDKSTIRDAPSLETFRYYVKRKYSPVDLLKQLLPNITWQQTKRALKGHAHDKLFGPAHTFMIDSTIADVYLVSSFNRNWIIGRPVVYLIRDVWSGMIVGLHVALEGPSWHTARFALFNAFSPKGDFLKAFGFNLGDEAWPCSVGCLNLVHDRGESLSIPSSDSANDLGLVLSPCPSFRPDLKGPIETLFHWIRDKAIKWMPGAVLSRARERGQRDCRLDATLTMYQFTRIIIHAILTFNRTADISDRLVGSAAEADVENNPIALWLWGLENLNGSPPRWDADTLYATLLPSGRASITEDGVMFAGRRFQGRFSDKMQWQEFARAFHTRKLKVRYDKTFPRQLYVLNDVTGRHEILHLAEGEQVPAHARLEEIIDFRAYRKLVREGESDARSLARISHHHFAEAEFAKAKAARDAEVPPSSNAEHVASIQAKRFLEAQMQRVLDINRSGRIVSDPVIESQCSDDDAPEGDLMTSLLEMIAEETEHVALD